MTTPVPSSLPGRPVDQPDARWRRAATVRAVVAGVAAGCYLALLAVGTLVAAADIYIALPMLVAGGAGVVASTGLLIANLGMRSRQRATTGQRWMIGGCVIVALLGVAGLVGLALFRVAVNDITAAMLAFGFVVPLLGVAAPAIPSLAAAFRRQSV